MLSFVVQGPFYSDWTTNLCQSIRRFFPCAEIVISAYHEEIAPELYNQRVTNEFISGSMWNIDAQINTSRNGINSATNQYVIKLRSDLLLTSSQILEHIDKLAWPAYNNKQVFSQRIGVCNLYSHRDLPMFLSDHVYIGLKEDLVKLFDIPFYGNKHTGFDVWKDGLGPEQWIAVSYIKKQFPALCFTSFADSIPYMLDNFLLFNTQSQLGIITQKSWLTETDIFSYRHHEWLEMYKNHRGT